MTISPGCDMPKAYLKAFQLWRTPIAGSAMMVLTCYSAVTSVQGCSTQNAASLTGFLMVARIRSGSVPCAR